MKKYAWLGLLGILGYANCYGADQSSLLQDPAWLKTYVVEVAEDENAIPNTNLVMDNDQMGIRLAINRFVYHDLKAEIAHLSSSFKCKNYKIINDTFEVEDCLLTKDNDDYKQNIYGKLHKKDGDNQIYTQVYAISVADNNSSLRALSLELLKLDPMSNPIDEWLLVVDQNSDEFNTVFENKKLKGTITVTLGRYMDEDHHAYLDSLGKLLMCKKAQSTDFGTIFNDCLSYRYYEIRDLSSSYYVMSSISSDLKDNQSAMDSFKQISKNGYEYYKMLESNSK